MNTNYKILLSFLIVVISLSIGHCRNILIVFLSYYFVAIIVYIIIGSIKQINANKLAPKKKFKKIIKLQLDNAPEEIKRISTWLDNEGLHVAIKSYGDPYLKNKMVEISYFKTLGDKISICGTTGKDYLVYSKDEELKIYLTDYFSYITSPELPLGKELEKLRLKSERSANYIQNYNEDVTYWNIIIRIQGYLFFSMSLFIVTGNDIADMGFLDLLFLFCYFVIEVLI